MFGEKRVPIMDVYTAEHEDVMEFYAYVNIQ
jgi:hypothetical protein